MTLTKIQDDSMKILDLAKVMAKEKIKHFISKDALNIDGFGKKVVEKFWNLKLIKWITHPARNYIFCIKF